MWRVDGVRSVAAVFVLRVVWGVCLAAAAMVVGIGLELHSDGAGVLASSAVIAAGVLLVPVCSAAIGRLAPSATPE
jgi:hypothetical protein